MSMQPVKKVRKGFTLVELAVVIVIIGVLAAFGVPKFLNSVERSKASEAFAYLSAIRDAQERYIAQEGIYATNISMLDIKVQNPKYFTIPTGGTITGTTSSTDTPPTWSMTLTRDAASSSKGPYTVTFTQDGFDPTVANSSIVGMPDINPLGTTGTSSS